MTYERWQSECGTVTLYCGDCLEVLPTLDGVDAVVTDPPYGIADSPFRSGIRGGKRTGGDNTWHPPSTWDKSINPAWCMAVCDTAPVVAWFGHWRKRLEVANYMPHEIRAEIVWAKNCHVGPPCPVAMRDERIWLFASSGIKGQCFETSVWDENIIPTLEKKAHKNEKPVPLMCRLIDFLAPEVGVVCDPFMGSGTTGVACVKTGRKFIGCEIDPGYFEIAKRRIVAELQRHPLFETESAV